MSVIRAKTDDDSLKQRNGKTMITCGILQALKNRGVRCAPFKCAAPIT